MRQSIMEKCRFRLHFAEPTRSLIEGVTEEEPHLDREEGGTDTCYRTMGDLAIDMNFHQPQHNKVMSVLQT